VAGALPTLILILFAPAPAPDLPEGSSAAPGAAATPAAAAAPGPAEAAPAAGDPPIVLFWTAPEGCPGVEELRGEIRRLAGPVPPPPERPEARAVVRRAAKDSWGLTLSTKAGALAGERKLTAGNCAELMRAAALVLALMINPSAGAEAAPPLRPPPPPPVIAAPPPPSPERPPGPLSTGADLLVGTGLLPGGAVTGVGLRLGWTRAMFTAELRGGAWAGRSAASAVDGSAGGSFELIDLDLAGCATARRSRRIAPGACIGATLWRGTGSGYGVTDPGSATAWWTGGFAEGNVRLRLTARNAVRLAIGAFLPFGRPVFALSGIGAVWQPAAFGARGMAGWELNF
jgi:hypothetical protein